MKYSRKVNLVVKPERFDVHSISLYMATLHEFQIGVIRHPIMLPMGMYMNKPKSYDRIAGFGPADLETMLWAVEKRINMYLEETTISWTIATKEEDDAS